MSLMLQPSIRAGDGQGWESPPIEECLSCSSSSSHTRSSHDSGGDWATSITSVEATHRDSALFDVSLHDGQGGVGSFWPWELDESCGDPPCGVRDRAHFLLQLRCLLRALLAFGVGPSCPAHGLFQDHGKDCGDHPRHPHSHAPPAVNAAWPHIANSSLLSQRRAHKPVRCGSTLHSPGFWPHDLDALICPQRVTGLSSGELCCQMVGRPHPRGPSQLVLGGPCTSHCCSTIHTAMRGHTEGPHALECPALCGCRD